MNEPSSNGVPPMARIWSDEHQLAFARATGDVNPMHMDPHVGRRTPAGGQAVHGVHAALWALDVCAAMHPLEQLSRMQIRFERFILVGDKSEITFQEIGAQQLRLSISVGGLRALTIQAFFGETREPGEPTQRAETEIPSRPIVVAPSSITEMAGAFRIVDAAPLGALAPRLAQAIGRDRIAAIGALSTLVGMIVPGLHSILSKIDVALTGMGNAASLTYAVKRFQPMLQSVTTQAVGPGIDAQVESFIRPRPVEQPSLRELRGLVQASEFAGVSALIVGGSRGLGATTAKLIAAGGGTVCITYVSSSTDAEAVASEIRETGRPCQVLHYDARFPIGTQLDRVEMSPTQFYHFATPRIFRQKYAPFEKSICDEMMQVYNCAFYDICQSLLDRGNPIAAFYPSSTAIDENVPNTVEYVMAKCAGEILSAAMAKANPKLRLLTERLPRIDTDQTTTIFPVPAAPPSTIMLPIVRRMLG